MSLEPMEFIPVANDVSSQIVVAQKINQVTFSCNRGFYQRDARNNPMLFYRILKIHFIHSPNTCTSHSAKIDLLMRSLLETLSKLMLDVLLILPV